MHVPLPVLSPTMKLSACLRCDHLPFLLSCHILLQDVNKRDCPRHAAGERGAVSGQVRGQQLDQTQVGHGEAAANDHNSAASPPRFHSVFSPIVTVCWTVSPLSAAVTVAPTCMVSARRTSALSFYASTHCLPVLPGHSCLPLRSVSKQVSGCSRAVAKGGSSVVSWCAH